ncbi:MAG: TraU family protein [Simkaniaceae bacterium]|nr:TraU family protein [Simkaniaceae bacterium]
MIRKAFALFFLLPALNFATIFNPVTDICWRCLFPLKVSGQNVTPSHTDAIGGKAKIFCHCKGGVVGLPVSYFAPAKICEVTVTPYRLVAFDINLSGKGMTKRGYVKATGSGHFESVRHVHLYEYPVLALFDCAEAFLCAGEKATTADITLSYMSEFDPFWLKDSWNNVLYPHGLIYGSALAQATCISDCIATTANKPIDKLSFCAGCQGSLFPYGGFIPYATGAVQASSLLVHRVLAKLHYLQLLRSYPKGKYCKKKKSTFPPKSSYKMQIAKPVKQSTSTEQCPFLGASEVKWGVRKTYPGKGEEFVYVIFARHACCVDPFKITARATGVSG